MLLSFLHESVFLDSEKYLDQSLERIARDGRAFSLFHQEFTSIYRDMQKRNLSEIHPPNRNTKQIAIRSNLPLTIPYRSKSFHGDLNRIAYSSILSKSHLPKKSNPSLSHSAAALDISSNSSYVNAYSQHHSHQNHNVSTTFATSVQMNSRSRFRTRNAYRSRSANRMNERDNVITRSIRASTLSAKLTSSTAHQSSQILCSSTGLSNSLRDICSIQSRLSNSLLRQFPRESSSIRNIYDGYEASNNILNPDIYVRWLKNKWQMGERHRQCSEALQSREDDYVSSNINRFRDSAFQSSGKFSYDSRRRIEMPFFSKTMKGILFIAYDYFSLYFYSFQSEINFFVKAQRIYIYHFILLCVFFRYLFIYLYVLCSFCVGSVFVLYIWYNCTNVVKINL